MRRGQLIILMIMTILAAILLGSALVIGLSTASLEQNGALQTQVEDLPLTSTHTPTPTNTPTNTPTPTDTPLPTPTGTLVVPFTATPTDTPTNRPTPTHTPTQTPPPPPPPVAAANEPNSGSELQATSIPAPVVQPTSIYDFTIVQQPVEYVTENHIFVILARVTAYNAPLGGYRLVGSHQPTGFNFEGASSCDHLCKTSSLGEIYDGDGNIIHRQAYQAGNLVFEAPRYDTGTWTLRLVDAQGRQASDIFQVSLDFEKKKWIYMHFSNTRTEDPSVSSLLGTPTRVPVCNCATDLYECSDFNDREAAQTCFDYCRFLGQGDVHKFDNDEDGVACEGL